VISQWRGLLTWRVFLSTALYHLPDKGLVGMTFGLSQFWDPYGLTLPRLLMLSLTTEGACDPHGHPPGAL
jgi:hypothetical protein